MSVSEKREKSNQNINPAQMSALTLAFIGDGVYSLLARELLIGEGLVKIGELHSAAVALVNAEAQAAAVKLILPLLSEREEAVYRRGRNASSGNSAKVGNAADYHSATGLEALFGYLYLLGDHARMKELFTAGLPGSAETMEN